MADSEVPFIPYTPQKHVFGAPPPRLAYWSIPYDRESAASILVDNFPSDKPLVFYFGGYETMYSARAPEEKICDEVHSYLKKFATEKNKSEKYSLILVKETPITTDSKYDRPEDYRNAPLTNIFATSREFVQTAILPLIKDAKNLDDVKRGLSKFNFIGHSYGTLFIQNVSNALREFFTEKTALKPHEIAQAMACIRVLNIGPIVNIVAKPADFSQLFITADNDSAAKSRYLDYSPLIENPHPLLSHAKIGDANLLLLSHHMGNTKPAVEGDSKAVTDRSKIDKTAHNLRIYMNINQKPRPESRPGFKIFQVNPSAKIARAFLDNAMKSSSESIKTGTPRKGTDILDEMIKDHLSPEAKGQLSRRLLTNQYVMERFTGEQDPISR